MPLNITSEQRANLEVLASYLEGLPPDYQHFGMRSFLSHDGRWICLDKIDSICSPCGTVACAVGHAPNAGIPISPYDEGWTDYSERVFGLPSEDDEWEWCFSNHWADEDDTHYGAAARIRYLLANGAHPRGYTFTANPAKFIEDYRPFLLAERERSDGR